MRLFTEKVFDEVIVGTAGQYARFDLTDRLGMPDMMVFQAVIDQVSGSSPQFTLWQYPSSDGLHQASAAAIIATTAVTANVANVLTGTLSPSQGYVILFPQLSGTTPVARVKLYATARGKPCCSGCAEGHGGCADKKVWTPSAGLYQHDIPLGFGLPMPKNDCPQLGPCPVVMTGAPWEICTATNICKLWSWVDCIQRANCGGTADPAQCGAAPTMLDCACPTNIPSEATICGCRKNLINNLLQMGKEKKATKDLVEQAVHDMHVCIVGPKNIRPYFEYKYG